jgi:hypothetical protein
MNEKNKNEPNFSLYDFKKWMGDQKDGPKGSKFIGLQVESKLNAKKLVKKVEPREGVVYEAVKDFVENGGTIADVDGQWFLIETDYGSFEVPRMFIKKV